MLGQGKCQYVLKIKRKTQAVTKEPHVLRDIFLKKTTNGTKHYKDYT